MQLKWKLWQVNEESNAYIFLYVYFESVELFDANAHKVLMTGHAFSPVNSHFAVTVKGGNVSLMQTVEDVMKVVTASI